MKIDIMMKRRGCCFVQTSNELNNIAAVPASGMTAEKQDYQCELCILYCNRLPCWQCHDIA